MAFGCHLLPKTDSSTFLLIYEQLISYLRESLFLLLKQMIHGLTNSFPPLLFGILSTRDNVSLFSHPIPCLCLHILTLGWGQSREKKEVTHQTETSSEMHSFSRRTWLFSPFPLNSSCSSETLVEPSPPSLACHIPRDLQETT